MMIWRNDLYLDRRFGINCYTDDTSFNDDDDIYGNGNIRKLYRHSRSDSYSECFTECYS